jgi:hypothetical protein
MAKVVGFFVRIPWALRYAIKEQAKREKTKVETVVTRILTAAFEKPKEEK